ncbi:MAG TPA: DUF2946 family protein [Zeimonas sp.]
MERLRPGPRRRIAASIACLAFVLQGIVPSLAHAMASAARAQFYPGEICSIDRDAARVRLAHAVDAEAPVPAQTLPDAVHCPFCALPFGTDAFPPTAFFWDARNDYRVASLPSVSAEVPPLRPSQGRPQTPRAPPLG